MLTVATRAVALLTAEDSVSRAARTHLNTNTHQHPPSPTVTHPHPHTKTCPALRCAAQNLTRSEDTGQ